MRVAIIITTGWSIRNFFRTACIKTLSKKIDLTIITTSEHYDQFLSEVKRSNMDFMVELIDIKHKNSRYLNFIFAFIKFAYF